MLLSVVSSLHTHTEHSQKKPMSLVLFRVLAMSCVTRQTLDSRFNLHYPTLAFPFLSSLWPWTKFKNTITHHSPTPLHHHAQCHWSIVQITGCCDVLFQLLNVRIIWTYASCSLELLGQRQGQEATSLSPYRLEFLHPHQQKKVIIRLIWSTSVIFEFVLLLTLIKVR